MGNQKWQPKVLSSKFMLMITLLKSSVDGDFDTPLKEAKA